MKRMSNEPGSMRFTSALASSQRGKFKGSLGPKRVTASASLVPTVTLFALPVSKLSKLGYLAAIAVPDQDKTSLHGSLSRQHEADGTDQEFDRPEEKSNAEKTFYGVCADLRTRL